MKFRLALVQADIVWASPDKNMEILNSMLVALEDIDLILLPEMFSTGFATSPEGIAESAPSCTLEWMKTLALQKGCVVAGSVATFENGKYFNRFHFVKPDGSVIDYDKRHLFTYGGEDKAFTAGEERKAVEWKGVRFLLSVCYDLRFPLWLRNRKDYDVLLCVASWPVSRRDAWDSLLKARAIENQCFVAAVNRTGNDPCCEYNGGSVLLDPLGRKLAGCSDNKAEIVVTEIDMASLETCRKTFPVLDDADDFELI